MSQCIPWGLAYTFDAALLNRTTGQHQVNPTLATGDFTYIKDAAAAANLTLPTITPAAGKNLRVTISAALAECATFTIYASDLAGAEWDDDMWTFHTPIHTGALCGKITASPTINSFVSSQLVAANANQYNGGFFTFLSGVCKDATVRGLGFVPGTDTVTTEALPAVPAIGDVWIFVNGA